MREKRECFFSIFEMLNYLSLMDILHTTLHHVDHTEDRVQEINIDQVGANLQIYINRLRVKILNNENRRRFKFREDETTLSQSLTEFLGGIYDSCQNNANRLHAVEKDAHRQIGHMVDIQKGSLLQSIIEDNDETSVIICKSDHNSFLDVNDFAVRDGLPWEKQIYKAFLATYRGDQLQHIYVYDTNAKISKYWWSTFLELEQQHTPEHNTYEAMEALDRKVIGKLKNKHPADHLELRNSMIGYFRSHEDFQMDDFLDNVLNQYQPIDDNLDKNSLIEKVRQLPDMSNFDSQFTIASTAIKKRQVRTPIPLHDHIELILKDHLDNLRRHFKPELKHGEKYLSIRTDGGYDAFNRGNQENAEGAD